MVKKILKAGEGMYLTNGETFAKTVELPDESYAKNWYEITEEEYEARQEAVITK